MRPRPTEAPNDRLPAPEDFSVIPDAFGIPYCYWAFGGFTADQRFTNPF